jgi:hypothetical protein
LFSKIQIIYKGVVHLITMSRKVIKVVVLSVLMVMVMAFGAMAAGTNPFADVPKNSIYYSDVAYLASRGIVAGYPDGAFSGDKTMTRYEAAAVVARALAKVDMEKANKNDVEALKRLVVEFKDELSSLGVKVDKIDKRVAVLEDRLGGWRLTGSFRFDANFGGGDNDSAFSTDGNKNDFSKSRVDLNLTKYIDENTYFFAKYRIGGGYDNDGKGDSTGVWREMYVNTVFPYSINARVGRFVTDFEAQKSLYTDNDALFGNFRADGFMANKSFFGGKLDVTGEVARNVASDYNDATGSLMNVYGIDNDDYMVYALDAQWNINEKAFAGVTGYWFVDDGNFNEDYGFNTYGLYGGYSFTPNIALKGIYYWQNLDDNANGAVVNDSPKAWKVALDLKQNLLKYTSLWIEYSRQDSTFIGNTGRYSIGGNAYDYVGRNIDTNVDSTASFWFVKANQQWGESKWSTFERFAYCDPDNDYDNETEWGLGVQYQYSPAMAFELAYDHVDHGDNANSDWNYDGGTDHVVRFRTTVNF